MQEITDNVSLTTKREENLKTGKVIKVALFFTYMEAQADTVQQSLEVLDEPKSNSQEGVPQSDNFKIFVTKKYNIGDWDNELKESILNSDLEEDVIFVFTNADFPVEFGDWLSTQQQNHGLVLCHMTTHNDDAGVCGEIVKEVPFIQGREYSGGGPEIGLLRNCGFFPRDKYGELSKRTLKEIYLESYRKEANPWLKYDESEIQKELQLEFNNTLKQSNYDSIPDSNFQTDFHASRCEMILEGVNWICCGKMAFRSKIEVKYSNSLEEEVVVLAKWNDLKRLPFIITKSYSSSERQKGNICVLNFFPVSNKAFPGNDSFWLSETDGNRLMKNAVIWAAKGFECQNEKFFEKITNFQKNLNHLRSTNSFQDCFLFFSKSD